MMTVRVVLRSIPPIFDTDIDTTDAMLMLNLVSINLHDPLQHSTDPSFRSLLDNYPIAKDHLQTPYLVYTYYSVLSNLVDHLARQQSQSQINSMIPPVYV